MKKLYSRKKNIELGLFFMSEFNIQVEKLKILNKTPSYEQFSTFKIN